MRSRAAGRAGIGMFSGLAAIAGLVALLHRPLGGSFRPGPLLDPVDGLYRTARLADAPPPGDGVVPGMEGPVEVAWDERGVPHIFAGSDLDAVRAAGYVTARDRLFQMDFLRRFTSGRLSEVFGPAAVSTDRRMRRTGIEQSVRANLERSAREGTPTFALFAAYAEGVNAWIERVDERDLPFEFRLFGYRPEPFTALDPGRIGWNLLYDLSYRADPGVDVAAVDSLLGRGAGDLLYPESNGLSVPIVPPEENHWPWVSGSGGRSAVRSGREPDVVPRSPFDDMATGFVEGKGSNNWAVAGSRSTTGAPILAGDMHLSLWLPSIWYEVHVVGPSMDSYGVTVPGIPLPIEAFNRSVGWAFTNTGADQIDHLVLETDAGRTRYRYDGQWRPITTVVDTIRVRGGEPLPDTLRWTHWGPVVERRGRTLAVRWVGSDTVRTFDAIWGMNRARSHAEFEEALRSWDAPMQNILVADTAGTIAIRSTGHLPLRADGGGEGYRDGSSSASEWIGRVPFDELPHSVSPARGYLTSTNQQPTDGTYPYYMGRDWRSTYRSIRIDALLASAARHRPDDVASWQADVHAVRRDWFVPLLEGVSGLPPDATRLRDLLAAWDGTMAVDRPEPLALDVVVGLLSDLVWDEPAFRLLGPPGEGALVQLLDGRIEGPWLDRMDTDREEAASDVLFDALVLAADSLATGYGGDPADWTWGRHHTLLLRHITQTPALSALWRGPFPFPGGQGTLSPGAGRAVTFSASWRVVLDFSGERPRGRGIYAGGPSGNPFSRRYDAYVDRFMRFGYHELPTPTSPEALPVRMRLSPPNRPAAP